MFWENQKKNLGTELGDKRTDYKQPDVYYERGLSVEECCLSIEVLSSKGARNAGKA